MMMSELLTFRILHVYPRLYYTVYYIVQSNSPSLPCNRRCRRRPSISHGQASLLIRRISRVLSIPLADIDEVRALLA